MAALPNCRGEYYARVIDDGSNANDYNDVSITYGGVVPALCVQLPTNN